jgi:hypothetical protein
VHPLLEHLGIVTRSADRMSPALRKWAAAVSAAE